MWDNPDYTLPFKINMIIAYENLTHPEMLKADMLYSSLRMRPYEFIGKYEKYLDKKPQSTVQIQLAAVQRVLLDHETMHASIKSLDHLTQEEFNNSQLDEPLISHKLTKDEPKKEITLTRSYVFIRKNSFFCPIWNTFTVRHLIYHCSKFKISFI